MTAPSVRAVALRSTPASDRSLLRLPRALLNERTVTIAVIPLAFLLGW